MTLDGIHHVTAITADAPRALDFSARVLGLRLVKKTVNYDDPGMYHLYFGDDEGRPGSILTFFEIPGAAAGRPGDGMFHTVSWRVTNPGALDFWADRLGAEGVPVERSAAALSFRDPEGLAMRIVAREVGEAPRGASAPDVPAAHALQGFDAVEASSRAPARTRRLLGDALGLVEDAEGVLVARGDERSAAIAVDAGPGAPGVPGAGTIHHVALSSADADHAEWGRRLAAAGAHAGPVLDRTYFRSIYVREPGGLLVEIATAGPGFAVDEPADALGGVLALPGWLEGRRGTIEGRLTPLADPRERAVA